MIGALWTGISGLSSQQQALDNESNNIANVNTVGFKASRISFADQMYQDRIGKGSKILDAEKLYTQGNLKLTGVNYDMALSGDGFFTVVNTRTSGAAETLYTRAGNFRMGDNGTLQDAAGNEVQGWAMTAIDSDNDVTSTNPNVSVFNTDYTKLLSSKIIRYGNYVETITAKATDYSSTSKSDSTTVFSGDGAKTKSSKISDIEEAIKDYTSWLQKLKDSPDASSSTSISQISQINFKTGTESVIGKDGDQIYVYIDGNKISQNYIPTTASESFKTSLLQSGNTNNLTSAETGTGTLPADPYITTITPTAEDNTRYSVTIAGTTVYYDSDTSATTQEIVDGLQEKIEDAGLAGGTTGFNITNNGTTLVIDFQSTDPASSAATYKSDAVKSYDVEASKIATYKALADKISQIPGLVATMVKEDSSTGISDVLEAGDSFTPSTKNSDMLKGIIQIKALIPGEEFIISEVGEVSGSSTIQGNYQTATNAVKGSGIAALETSRDALAKLITGKQQDVYTSSQLNLNNSPIFKYSINIYDKELDKNIDVPTLPLIIDTTNSSTSSNIDNLVEKFNSASSELSKYVVARNVNDNLVIETLDSNYDVEFTSSIKELPKFTIDLNEVIDNAIYSFDMKINGNSYPLTIDYSGKDTLNQTAAYEDIRNQISAQISAINSSFQLAVTPQVNGVFSVYSGNDSVSFVDSISNVSDVLPVTSVSVLNPGIPSTLDNTKLTVPFKVDINEILSSEIFGSEIIWIENPDGTYESSGIVDLSNKTEKLISLNPNYIKDIELTFDGFGDGSELFTLKDGSTIIGEITGTNYSGNENETTPLDTSYVSSWDYSDLETYIGDPNYPFGTVKLFDIKKDISVFAKGADLKLNKMIITMQTDLSTAPKVPSDPPPYRFTIKDTTNSTTLADINYIPTSSSPALFYAGLLAEIKNTQAYQDGLINATSDETGVSILNHNLIFSSVDNSVEFDTTQGLDGVAKEVQHTIDVGGSLEKSKSVFTLTINNKVFTYKTDETPTPDEVRNYFISAVQSDSSLNELIEITGSGDDIFIKNKDSQAKGYLDFISSLESLSLTLDADGYETVTTSTSELKKLDKNPNYSGRKGAGAEFIEIVNRVDQTASKDSLQLRLDTLGISDSAFGEFSVDSTGLITMKQDGAEFAVGQIAIAVFNNNRGLNPMGDNLLAKTNESGDPIYNLNNNKTAKVEGKTLELSTADLSESLVNLMVYQRSFEANAKSITTSDELLNTLINLKKM